MDGEPLGVIGIFFDWEPQPKAALDGVRLEKNERDRTRYLPVDASQQVIAASEGNGMLMETFLLRSKGETIGHYIDVDGRHVGFALTVGYETYRGLGWYGIIVQDRR